jgi:hypothetical protein
MARSLIRDALELFGITFFYGINTLTIPGFILYGLSAADQQVNLVKFFLFGLLPIWVVATVIVRIYLENQGWFDRNPEYIGFNHITVHSPGQTLLGKHIPQLRSVAAMVSISLVLGALFGLLVGVSGSISTGVPVFTEGSIQSDASSLGLAVEPAVSSETLFFNVGLFGLFQAGILFFLIRNDARYFYANIVAKSIAVVLTTVSMYVFHIFRYGAAAAEQIGIIFLGLITNTLMALVNSAIPAYFIHAFGNLFLKARTDGIWTQAEIVAIALSVMMIGLIGTYVFFLNPLLNGRVPEEKT